LLATLTYQVRLCEACVQSPRLILVDSFLFYFSFRMSFSGISGSAKEDLVVSLAILVLHDGGVAVSAENINAVVGASGNSVAPYWGALYSKVLAGRNIDDMLLKPGAGGGPAPAAGGASASGPAAGAAAAEKKEEKKEEGMFLCVCLSFLRRTLSCLPCNLLFCGVSLQKRRRLVVQAACSVMTTTFKRHLTNGLLLPTAPVAFSCTLPPGGKSQPISNVPLSHLMFRLDRCASSKRLLGVWLFGFWLKSGFQCDILALFVLYGDKLMILKMLQLVVYSYRY
jgi:large subunit ribosomal protein LP1